MWKEGVFTATSTDTGAVGFYRNSNGTGEFSSGETRSAPVPSEVYAAGVSSGTFPGSVQIQFHVKPRTTWSDPDTGKATVVDLN